MKYFKIILIGLLFLFCLTGCEKLEYKETQVNATVMEKRHKNAYITRAGKTTIYHSAKNYVTLEYDGFQERINNKTLYNSVIEGDTVLVIYGEGVNEEGMVKRQYLKLID